MTDTADPPVARQLSMHVVTQVLLDRGPTSRAELAKLTGLSKQTISDVVRELERAGWLKPLGRTSGRPGRSAIVFEINGQAGLAAAIDLGGTKLHVALCDLSGNTLLESLLPTDPRGGATVIEQIGSQIDVLTAQIGVATHTLRVVVLGAPGVFHPETTHIEAAPNIPGFGEIDVLTRLQQRLRVPVIIENDVNLAARGEQWRGHGAGLKNFVFIAMGTGIGMGIIANGQLLRGAHGAGGEIGYLPLGGDPYDPRGFRLGTLETAVGSAAIAQRYAGFGGPDGATVQDIFTALATGDAAAAATIEETARILAQTIAAVGAVLDPEIVILGGSIGVREELLEIVRKYLRRCSPSPLHVEASVLANRAALTGALGVAVARMHDDLFGVGLPAPHG